jgi:hypothetical protein
LLFFLATIVAMQSEESQSYSEQPGMLVSWLLFIFRINNSLILISTLSVKKEDLSKLNKRKTLVSQINLDNSTF